MESIIASLAVPLVVILVLPALSEIAGLTRLAAGRKSGTPRNGGTVPHLCILVPAHNEAAMIGGCVRSLVGMTRRGVDFDVVVVADNCTDDTAAIASDLGARVLERTDPVRRGKPHALQWAMDLIGISRYDAVVIVDADSVVDPEFASGIAPHAPLRDKGVQTYNGISNRTASWLSRLAGLLISVRYDGQFVAKQRVGLNCPMANGMVMGTDALARCGWPTESLTENWEVYARFTAAGVPIEYAREARLGSQQSEGLAQSSVQRRRWQAGRWQVLRANTWPLLSSPCIGWHQRLDAVAELAAPGPVVHATLAAALAALLLLFPSALGYALVVALGVSLVPLALWTAWAIARSEDPGQMVIALARLPFYAVWRIIILLRSITVQRRGIWTRSPRHSIEVP